MKKYSLVIALIVMIFAMGCGKGNAEVDSVNGSNEMNVENNVSKENLGNANQEDVSTVTVPDVEYEEWLTDDEDNKLIGFNVPEGWTITERRTKRNFTIKDSFSNEMTILCVPKDAGRIPDIYENGCFEGLEGWCTYFDDGNIDTDEYGTIKFIYEDGIEENLAGSELAVFKLNEEYYVCVELLVWSTEDFAAHYEYTKMLESNVKEMFGIEESLNIIITEAEQFEVPDYDYPHWLEDENANKLIGFNSPIGMNRVESESEGILMRTANGNKAFQIMITDSYYASIIKKGRDEANEDSGMIYTEKGEIETIYGNIKLYELHDTYMSKEYNGDILIKEEENHFYMDYGLLNFKGKYILFTYVDYTKQDGYTGELEEIIKNQLFVQE